MGSFLCFLPLRPAGEALGSAGGAPTRSLSTTSSSSGSGTPGPSGLVRQNSTSLTGKPGALPANLDDMKVGGYALVALAAASLASRGAVTSSLGSPKSCHLTEAKAVMKQVRGWDREDLEWQRACQSNWKPNCSQQRTSAASPLPARSLAFPDCPHTPFSCSADKLLCPGQFDKVKYPSTNGYGAIILSSP